MISLSEHNNLMSFYEKGLTDGVISKRTGVSISKVFKWRRLHRLEANSFRAENRFDCISLKLFNELMEWYEKELNDTQIMEKIKINRLNGPSGFSREWISKWRANNNLPSIRVNDLSRDKMRKSGLNRQIQDGISFGRKMFIVSQMSSLNEGWTHLMDQRERSVAKELLENPGLNTFELAAKLGTRRINVSRALTRMRKRGIVEKKKINQHQVVYHLTDSVWNNEIKS